MLFLKKNYTWCLFIITSVVLSFALNAKAYQWTDISQQQYIDNLLDCSIKIHEYKWSKNHKPKEGGIDKSSFLDFYSTDVIKQQVLDSLKMQYILQDEFNTTITSEMLQYDIERMARSTKDPESLKAIFAMFDNDINTIAQCISRPYLVRQRIQSNYDFNNTIHQATKDWANKELRAYLNGKSTAALKAHESTMTFVLKSVDNTFPNNTAQAIIKLNQEEFDSKIKQLQNNTLQEKNYAFVYSEIIEQNRKKIKVKTLSWSKRSFNLWIKQQKDRVFTSELQNSLHTLPKITGVNQLPEIKAGVAGDYWTAFGYVPTGRSSHSIIWTGSEMIVWGGVGLNTGGRYDPITDNWQPTSTGLNTPSGRSEHTAIWDDVDKKMIVWGGSDGTKLNTGGLYDPETDTWQQTSTGTNVPTARYDHTAIWDNLNNQMIIWGGYDGSLTNTGGRYDPTTDSWLATSIGSNVPTARNRQTAIWDDDNKQMIIWGGQSFGSHFNTGGRYNPITNSWQPTSIGINVPTARELHTAVWDKSNNKMIIWGGYGGANTNTGGIYDPSTDSWQITGTGSNVPTARNSHTAIWDDLNNQMIIWGGGTGGSGSQINSGGRYNPMTDSWQATNIGSNVPSPRLFFNTVWTGSEMIVWGGALTNGTQLNTGGRYNPNNDSWQATFTGVNIPSARRQHTAIWDTANNQMIVWGGYSGSFYLNTGGRYDPITNTWQATSFGPSRRVDHTAVWDNINNQMIIWGGQTDAGSRTNSGSRYDPMTDSWQATSMGLDVPSSRSHHTAVWDTVNKQMIVWGGLSAMGNTNTGGRYDPSTDSWQTTSTSSNVPSSRNYHSAIWDPANNQMIIWGGSESSGFTNTGGRYDPNTDSWQTTSTGSNVPSARFGNTFILDPLINQIIVWGGDDGANTNTGGIYDPMTDSWQMTSTGNNVPSSRSGYTAVWDSKNNKMIIWGGRDTQYTNTGGRYDPSTDSWLPTSIENAPPGRAYHTAVWDGSKMLVWGGQESNFSYTKSLMVYSPFNDPIFANGFE